MIQSYLWKLHITTSTSTSICIILSDTRCLYTSFAAYNRFRTISARQVWSKKYIRGERVKDRWSSVPSLPLSLFSLLLIFLPSLFPTRKQKQCINRPKITHYRPTYLHTTFFFFSMAPGKTYSSKHFQYPFFILPVIQKTRARWAAPLIPSIRHNCQNFTAYTNLYRRASRFSLTEY